MVELLQRIADSYFKPPPLPDHGLGYVGKLTGAKSLAEQAMMAAYWAGVREGILFGFGLAVTMVLILWVLRINPFKVTL